MASRKTDKVKNPGRARFFSIPKTRSLPGPALRLKAKVDKYLSRRPHRSFRRTRRRDYARSLNIPGYWSFTLYVLRVIRTNARLMIMLTLSYALIGILFVGLSSQDSFDQFSELLDETSESLLIDGGVSAAQAGVLLLAGVADSISPELSQAQQIYAVLLLLMTWLTTVWLLRSILAGNNPRLRDGLYNAGAPIVVTGIIFIVLVLQLLPAIIGAIVLNGAITTDVFATGFLAMIVSFIVILLTILSLYWAVGTVFALIISTLPGMYPWQALRAAGDVVVGRRVRLLLRIMWLVASSLLLWIIVILPTVLIERALVNIFPVLNVVPVVPVIVSVTGASLVVWTATYMYLLYRKVVEDDANPA